MSVESVHEVRVAARRLLAQCALVETLGQDADLARARVRLKKFLSGLSECRDVQVQQELYAAWCDRFPGLEPVRRHLRKRERRLARSAARRVRRFKARKVKVWLALVDQRCRFPDQDRKCQRRLSARVMSKARLTFQEVSRLVVAVEGDDAEGVHRARVAFKRFRYVVEALSPEWTGRPRRELRRLARFQRQMGRIQDLRVAAMVLAAASVDPVVVEEFARFLKRQQARAFVGFRFWAQRLQELWPPALS
jgi:CHAD domain-containing protein